MSQAINISLDLPATPEFSAYVATDGESGQGQNPAFAQELERQVFAHENQSKTDVAAHASDEVRDDNRAASISSPDILADEQVSDAQQALDTENTQENESAIIQKAGAEQPTIITDVVRDTLTASIQSNDEESLVNGSVCNKNIAPEKLLQMLDSAQQMVTSKTYVAPAVLTTQQQVSPKPSVASATESVVTTPEKQIATTQINPTNNEGEPLAQQIISEQKPVIAKPDADNENLVIDRRVKADTTKFIALTKPENNVVVADDLKANTNAELIHVPLSKREFSQSQAQINELVANTSKTQSTKLESVNRVTATEGDVESLPATEGDVDMLPATEGDVDLLPAKEFEKLSLTQKAELANELTGKQATKTQEAPSVQSNINKGISNQEKLPIKEAQLDSVKKGQLEAGETQERSDIKPLRGPVATPLTAEPQKVERQINVATAQPIQLNESSEGASTKTAEMDVVDELVIDNDKEMKSSVLTRDVIVKSNAGTQTVDSPTIRVANINGQESAQAIHQQQTHSQTLEEQVTQQQNLKHVEKVATEVINVNHKNFSQQVKEKVMVMISQKLQSVDIQLDPPELGNVHVRVNLQGEQAMVNFVVQQPQAKEAIEQHMNRLRDMLSESGIDLGDTDVQQQFSQNDTEFNDNEGFESSQSSSEVLVEDEQNIQNDKQVVNVQSIGIDYFA